MWLTILVAHAVEPGLGVLAGGFDGGRGVRMSGVAGGSLELRVAPTFAVRSEVAGAVFQPTDAPSVDPFAVAVTRRRFYGLVEGVFSPIHGSIGSRPLAVDLGVGTGLVQTLDDLEALQATNDPVAMATERQIRPMITASIGPRIALDSALELQMRGRWMQWVDVVEGLDLRTLQRLDVVVSAVWKPGAGRRVP